MGHKHQILNQENMKAILCSRGSALRIEGSTWQDMGQEGEEVGRAYERQVGIE